MLTRCGAKWARSGCVGINTAGGSGGRDQRWRGLSPPWSRRQGRYGSPAGAIQPFVSRYVPGIMHVALALIVRYPFQPIRKMDNGFRELLQRM